MMTSTNPRHVDNLLADAREVWEEFGVDVITGATGVEAFTRFRAALAVADAADEQAKVGPYKAACARYKVIVEKVNSANARIAAATVHDEMPASAPNPGLVRTRTAEEKEEQLRAANRGLNALALEVNAAGYVPRADDDTSPTSTLHLGIEKPHAPSPRKPSSGFETNYARALEAVFTEHFDNAESNAIAAWRAQQ